MTTTEATNADEPLRIRGLKVENYKRIVAVELHPDGKSIVLGGRNAQGKSSLLDAIADALGGKRRGSGATMPLRNGALRGEVTVDLGEYVVRRVWTPTGDKLVVEDPKGLIFKSPQSLLDKLLGDISFDPLAFMRLDGAKLTETLRKLVGVDTRQIESDRQRRYDSRTSVNRELAAAKAHLAGISLPERPPEPPALASVAGLLAEAAELRGLISANRAAEARPIEIEGRAAALRAEVDEIVRSRVESTACATAAERAQARIAKAREELEEALKVAPAGYVSPLFTRILRDLVELATAGDAYCEHHRGIAGAAGDLYDEKCAAADALARERDAASADAAGAATARAAMEERLARINSELADHDEASKRAAEAQRAIDRWLQLKASWDLQSGNVARLSRDAEALTAEIDALDAEKLRLVSAAKFPIDGLGIEGDTVTFRRIPLAQASQAERLKVCVAIGAALNPRVAIAMVREGAFLDDDGLKECLAAIEAAGLQAWVEVVGDRDGVGVIIEDGRVSEDRTEVVEVAK